MAIMSSQEKSDFIVVGAGASGCAVAWRLAHSKKCPSVLLVEAGGKNDALALRVDGDRWVSRFNPQQAWGYQTVPQKDLNGRVISYDRGRGLGGSTGVNFCVYNTGPRDDYEEIARIVGDDEWRWLNAQKRFMRLESYYGNAPHIPEHYKKYLDPNPEDHGKSGPLKIGFSPVWENSLTDILDACDAAGFPTNPDMNSGNPIGVSVAPNSAYKGIRTTAADMLEGAPSNLRVLTDAQISRVIFEGKRAVGISTVKGRTFYANKDVILSAGSLDTPKILMLSGVGPASELKKHNIPVVSHLASVGQNLRDHHHVFITWERADHTTERKSFYSSNELQSAARLQWEKDQTGPLAEYGTTLGIGWLKSCAVLASQEFDALPEHRKAHLLKSTVPTYEVAINPGNAEYFIDPDDEPALTSMGVFVLNTQSTGTVTLQSSDPSVPLLFDPEFFSHAYDRRVAIEGTREVLKLAQHPAFAKDTVRVLSAPNSDSEEDILAYWREAAMSTWHMTGTCKMGKEGDEGACVDNNFKVVGIKSLRVVDMSVVPIIPNNHTQTTAYCVGLTAGDKFVTEYGLDG